MNIRNLAAFCTGAAIVLTIAEVIERHRNSILFNIDMLGFRVGILEECASKMKEATESGSPDAGSRTVLDT